MGVPYGVLWKRRYGCHVKPTAGQSSRFTQALGVAIAMGSREPTVGMGRQWGRSIRATVTTIPRSKPSSSLAAAMGSSGYLL